MTYHSRNETDEHHAKYVALPGFVGIYIFLFSFMQVIWHGMFLFVFVKDATKELSY